MELTTSHSHATQEITPDAETLFGAVEAAADQLEAAGQLQDEVEHNFTPFERRATVDFALGVSKKAYDEALTTWATHLDEHLDERPSVYIQQAAELALRGGVVIAL